MGIPQILLIVLYALSLGANLVEHGKSKVVKNNFFTTLISTLITFGLLWWGGFFS